MSLTPLITRVFAGELARSSHRTITYSPPILLTPGGAACTAVYIAGPLTRVMGVPGDRMGVCVADPTGIFEITLHQDQRDLATTFSKMTPPLFIAVLGEVHLQTGSSGSIVTVRPLEVYNADRTFRDRWVIRTAEDTLLRLIKLQATLDRRCTDPIAQEIVRLYRTDTGQLRDLAAMVRDALATVRDTPVPQGINVRALLLAILAQHSGPRGMAVDDILLHASREGLTRDNVLAEITALIKDDECYQPGAGLIKIL